MAADRDSRLGKRAQLSSIAGMISAGQLSDEQKQAMAGWAQDGATIADLQQRLKEQFGLGVTYMEARFLVLDLGITIQEAVSDEPPRPKQPEEPEDEAAGADDLTAKNGTVQVTLDQLALPGTLVSGKARFSDGESAVWVLDQLGRPGLDPDTPGYRPSAEDIAEFQRQLSGLLRTRGF
jgi:hypothetical protein